MKNRRKTLIWATLLLGLILAATTAPAVTLDVGDGAGMVGETVLVPVILADVAAPIWSVELNLVFYYAYASLTGVQTTGTLTETWGMSFQGNSGSGHVNFASATPLVGGGVLCYLEFLLLGGNGNALIDLTSAVINEDDLEINLIDGYILITPIPTVNIYPDNGLLVVGESLEFSTSGGTAPYTYSTSDPLVADFTSDDQFLQALGPGSVQVFTEDADGFTNGTTGLVEVRPFRLNALDAAGTEGQTVLVPIVIFDPVPYDIVSAEISATWYPNSATFNGVFTGGSLIESFFWSTPVVSSSPGSLFLTTVGVDPLPASGLFCFLEFTVYNSFTLQLGPGLFNETYQALPHNGYVSVSPLPNLTLTPYTTSMLVGDYLELTVGGGPTLPVVYSWSDSSVLTVSEDGLVHALAAGTSEIWLTDNLGAESNHILVDVYDFSLPTLQSGIHADETVLIPVKVERELDDLDIFSLELGVSFNPYYVEFLGATSTDSATEAWGQPLAVDEGGLAKVYHAGPSRLTGCPTGVVYLEFLGLPTIGSVYNGITLHDALFNEGDPRVLINYGDPCIVSPVFDLPAAGLQMLPNHPNPFNPGTTISFRAGQRGGPARLAVYSPRGELVRVLLNQEVAPGSLHQVYWDGRDDNGRLQPSGVYFSRVDVAGDRQMQKMMLIK